jgi:hypothetical protein
MFQKNAEVALKCTFPGWVSLHLSNRFIASSQMIFRERQDLQPSFNCYILTANLTSSYCSYAIREHSLSQLLRTINPKLSSHVCVGLYVQCLLCPILTKIKSLDKFKQNYQIYHFTKIRVMGVPLIHADKRTDGYNDANYRLSELLY